MKEFKVYCHTNKSNGKKYVGITGKSIEDRWRRGEGYRNNEHFYRAIIKYGWEGFTHEVLYTVNSEEEALLIEKELIQKWKTSDSEFGYNLLVGGNLNSDENKKLLIEGKIRNGAIRKVVRVETGEVFLGALDAERKTGIDASQISGVCIHKKNAFTAGGYHWCFEDDLPFFQFPERSVLTKKVAIVETGECFNSIRDAERKTGVKRNQISNACKGKSITAGGFHWKFVGDGHVVRKTKALEKRVVNLDTGEEFSSVIEAARKAGTTTGIISSVCRGESKTAKGFRWAYLEEDRNRYIKKGKTKNENKHKGKLVKNSDTEEVFDSLAEAAKSVGVAYNNISAACQGIVKTSGGYHWEYIDY